jgi:hypothetical protein
VRALLGRLEGERAPIFDLRVEAVRRLGELEVGTRLRHCGDTGMVLQRLRIAADQGPIIDRRRDTSYCVQRTSLLLGGYAVDHDEAAIGRLGLWSMLCLRWPLLAAHLAREPQDLDALQAGEPPDGIDDELAPVFEHSAAVRLARAVDGVLLRPDDVRRFTTPLARRETPAPISAAA